MKRALILAIVCCIYSITSAQEFIDLGLSVDWCSVNIGASNTSQSGDLFAWGEIEPRKSFSMENYKYRDPENEQWTQNIGSNISETQYDPATVRNKEWRLPTQKELLELCEKCIWIWIDNETFCGYEVVGPNGNHIFLPIGGLDSFGSTNAKSGNYWSGTLSQGLGRTAISLTFNNEEYFTNGTYKVYGKLVRPVKVNPNYKEHNQLPEEWADSKYTDLIEQIISENYEDAFNTATMLASKGDAKAQCVLATMYMCEVGTIRNYESAQELLVQAAEQGYSRGEYMLGGFGSLEKSHEFMKMLVGDDKEQLYANDNSFWYQMLSTETKPQTYKDAFRWFLREDKEWGYRDIMYYAGIVLIRGDYGYKNQEAGLQWLIKSAQLGYDEAIELLQQLFGGDEQDEDDFEY